MKDMQRMMKEAQKMAAEMQKAQAEIAEMSFEGVAGGGVVKVVASGDFQIESVTIAPDLFEGAPDADDIELLEDAIAAAVNDALDKAREAQQEAMGPMSAGLGGMGLPGT
jgi:DNA-binding YbaB/EbfC family protein